MKTENQTKHTTTLLITCAFAAAVVATSLLTGCRHSRKNNVEVQPSASVGQQLQDLDASYKKGIITEREYERLKNEIIRKND